MQSQILERIHKSKHKYIIGVDECGTGALAGSVYVCAFIAPKAWNMKGVVDSKTITSTTRKKIAAQLMALPYEDKTTGLSIVNVHPNSDIYKEYGGNLHGVLKYLYWKAVSRLLEASKKDAIIVLDGNIKFPEFPYSLGESISMPKADALIPHVSAASIIAKVNRDEYMVRLGEKYPQFEWKSNKGYSTPSHLKALKKFGYCEEHRVSYEPIKSMVNNYGKDKIV